MTVTRPVPMVHVTEFTPLVLASIYPLPEAIAQQHVRSAITKLAQRVPISKRTIYAAVGTNSSQSVYCLPPKEDQIEVCSIEEVQYPGCGKLEPVRCVNDVWCTPNSFYAEEPYIWFSNTAPCPQHVEIVVSCEPKPTACFFDAAYLKHAQDIAAYAVGLAQNMPSAEWYNVSAYNNAERHWNRFVTRLLVQDNRGGMAQALTPRPRRFI